MNVGKTIATIRKAKGLSQTALAKQAQIMQGTLCQIEIGHTRPGTVTFELIAKALGVTVGYIYILSFEECDLPCEKAEQELLYPSIKQMLFKLIQNPKQ
jgi:transcriptional regulator with XRE-family HTH domain